MPGITDNILQGVSELFDRRGIDAYVAKMPDRQAYQRGRKIYRGRARYTAKRGTYGYQMKWVKPEERKFIDFELNDEAFTAAWAAKNPTTVNCISAVPQGDTESSRDGRVYYLTRISIRGEVTIDPIESSVAPLNDRQARICLVLDTQTNGTEIVGTSVMDGGQTRDIYSFRNLQETGRYRVLYDKTWTIRQIQTNEGAANLFAGGLALRRFSFNHNFKKPIKVICTGTAGTVATMSDNSLSVIGVADSATIGLSYQARLRYCC